MPGPSKGLIQHYGFWTLFVTTPLVIVLSSYLFRLFIKHIRRPEDYCVPLTDEMSEMLQALVQRHVASLQLRLSSTWILVFAMVALSFWWLVNIVVMLSPVDTYAHDVFDGYGHPFGFYVTRIYVLFIFGFVYPLAAFAALHVTGSLISTLRFVCKNDLLRINFFHADNCGGTSAFGHINLIILAIYSNWFAVIYAMYITHRRTYLVLAVALIACTVLAVAQSVVAVYHIRKAVADKRRELIRRVSERLHDEIGPSLSAGCRFPNDLLAFRNHLVGVHAFPYASGAVLAVNVIRFTPALVAVLSFFNW